MLSRTATRRDNLIITGEGMEVKSGFLFIKDPSHKGVVWSLFDGSEIAVRDWLTLGIVLVF